MPFTELNMALVPVASTKPALPLPASVVTTPVVVAATRIL
jgi:hypothetical protein